MKRLFTAFIATIALTLALALPASAGAKFDEVRWECDSTLLVSAPEAARHGINTANDHAGQTFKDRFGEECDVR
jgi:hypothetical protein